MSLIITADFQAEWQNLDQCEQAWQQILSICAERELKLIAVCGDLKQHYNPVDIRVVKWWLHAIRTAKRRNIDVLCVLGNHDRVGQYTDADNWFPILKRAGAQTFDTAAVTGDGERRVFVLPYSSVSEAKRRAKDLLRFKPDKDKDVLLFHHGLAEATYNKLGEQSDAQLHAKDLHPEHYLACIGGDIHMPQQIGANVYYTGSPFCTSWGEANQRKRYMVVAGGRIASVPSNIPGWYDPSWPGFREDIVNSWRGLARVRVQVQINYGDDLGHRLEHARKAAEHRFPNADIVVVPKFLDGSRGADGKGSIKTTDTDEKKIAVFVVQTCPKGVSTDKAKAYMLAKLANFAGGLRTTAKIRFDKAKAKNFLSFKKLEIDFRKQGIVVVQGINKDRGKKSNGSGKTNYLQPIPVALWGRTFKEQTHDHWRYRWSPKDEPSYVKLYMHDDHKVMVKRGRKPIVLQMTIDGKDKSSGMKSTDRDGTQTQVEQRTGFTWQTLANAVYIDRKVADAFLSGTKKERTDVLSRFQNLERFALALEVVKADIKELLQTMQETNVDLSETRVAIADCKESLAEMKVIRDAQVSSARKELNRTKKLRREWKDEYGSKIAKLQRTAQDVQDRYDVLLEKLSMAEKLLFKAKTDYGVAHEEQLNWMQMHDKCPTCAQPVTSKWKQKHAHDLAESTDANRKSVIHYENRVLKLRKATQSLDGEHDEIMSRLSRIEEHGRFLKMKIQTIDKQYHELFRKQHTAEVIVHKKERKLSALISRRVELKDKLEKLDRKRRLYDYAADAFSRDGIPAFLNRQLVPVLNKAADYYAELFSDREVLVRFAVIKGEFVPQVINDKGGEGIDDQSTGERALAGLIASFALREVAPPCNLLILDEPGEGLDSQTARQFASSLQTLKKRFESIFITTHNQEILSALSGERTITIQKHKRVSHVLERQYE